MSNNSIRKKHKIFWYLMILLDTFTIDKKKILNFFLVITFFLIYTIANFYTFLLTTDYNIFSSDKLRVRFFIFHLGILYFFTKTFFEEPGILPRSRNNECILFSKSVFCVPIIKNIILNDCIFQSKFCETCNVWRPSRTSHCSLCNNCILLFDHHCPWIGTCIGLRNYRWFLLFIYFIFWYLFHSIEFSLYIFSIKGSENLKKKIFRLKYIKYIKYTYIFVCLCVLAIVTLIGTIFTGLLICFHIYLCLQGTTTSEIFKSTDRQIWTKNTKKEILTRLHGKTKISLLCNCVNNENIHGILVKKNTNNKYLRRRRK
nr:putative protein S-acyltransferase 1 [Cryptomonas sp.]